MDVTETVASGQATDDADRGVSLDDAIKAAFGASEGKAEDGEPKAQSLKPEADKNAGDEPAGEKPVGEDVQAKDQDKQAAEGDGAKSPVEAPKHWPENRRQTFAKMPPEVQAEWLAHDKDLQGGFTRKSQELSDKAKLADSVKGLFDDDTRSQMARAGVDEVGTIRYLLDLQRAATHDPVSYVKWFMQKAGLQPDHLGFPQTQQPETKAAAEADPLAQLLSDPEVKQLKAELAALKGDFAEIMTARERAEAAQEIERRQRELNVVTSIRSEIGNFRSTQDEHGQLKYPHFDQVQAHMGALMDADPDLKRMPDGPDKLQKAYDMAVWARSDLRQSFVDQEASKRAAEARKKEEAARAKSVTAVRPGSGAPVSNAKPKDLDNIIAGAMQQHGLRA